MQRFWTRCCGQLMSWLVVVMMAVTLVATAMADFGNLLLCLRGGQATNSPSLPRPARLRSERSVCQRQAKVFSGESVIVAFVSGA
jgi:hypothetical protein